MDKRDAIKYFPIYDSFEALYGTMSVNTIVNGTASVIIVDAK